MVRQRVAWLRSLGEKRRVDAQRRQSVFGDVRVRALWGLTFSNGPRPHILDHHRIPLTSAKPSAIACELTVCSGLADDCSRCQEIDAALTANPDRPLRVYRRGALALKVRSIREGARLTVKIAGNGTPIFTLDDP